MVTWTREEIIRQILHREAAGLPLKTTGKDGVDSSLYQAASRIFGSWGNALKSAGIAPARARAAGRWSPLRVLATIRALSRRRRPIPAAELQRRLEPVMDAARRIYGSWPKALMTAGVDPLTFRRILPWTKDRIIEAVLTRALNNEPLGSCTVRPRSLAEAAVRVYGSWQSALTAAGIDPKQYAARRATADRALQVEERAEHPARVESSYWSKELVGQAILTRLQKRKPLNAVAVLENDKSLYKAAKRRYGSWRAALLAAGLDPNEFRCQRRRSDRQPVAHPHVPPTRVTVLSGGTCVASNR